MLSMDVAQSSSGGIVIMFSTSNFCNVFAMFSYTGLYSASRVFLSSDSIAKPTASILMHEQILLSHREQQVHILICTLGQSLPSMIVLLSSGLRFCVTLYVSH